MKDFKNLNIESGVKFTFAHKKAIAVLVTWKANEHRKRNIE